MITSKKIAASSRPMKQTPLQLQARCRGLKWVVFLFVFIFFLSLVVYHFASLVQPQPLPLPQSSSFYAFVPPLISAKKNSNNNDNVSNLISCSNGLPYYLNHVLINVICCHIDIIQTSTIADNVVSNLVSCLCLKLSYE